MDIEEKPARACSGCAGDYEDPDRSAWEEEWLGRLLELARGCIRPGRTQRETLLMALRLAAAYEQWVTLAELAEKTKFPPASISAQLRHLRKAEYGGWAIAKRRREWVREEVVWEYRLAEGGGSGIKGGKGKERGGGDECKAGNGV